MLCIPRIYFFLAPFFWHRILYPRLRPTAPLWLVCIMSNTNRRHMKADRPARRGGVNGLGIKGRIWVCSSVYNTLPSQQHVPQGEMASKVQNMLNTFSTNILYRCFGTGDILLFFERTWHTADEQKGPICSHLYMSNIYLLTK